eukprot:TRINITY_DN63027_c0_g1_i1.p1 TRINITY_DN63027_c0_g1~~TRINITY_DN63027_c0_g1_i1.p1  ORF type:complete len:299 (+),score=29.10 TRINITY_DN63027_c0_g1_i1:214-1110(+)
MSHPIQVEPTGSLNVSTAHVSLHPHYMLNDGSKSRGEYNNNSNKGRERKRMRQERRNRRSRSSAAGRRSGPAAARSGSGPASAWSRSSAARAPSTRQIELPLRIQILRRETVLRGQRPVDRSSDLPDVVYSRRLLRQGHGREDQHRSVGVLRRCGPDVEGDRRRKDALVGGDVVGVDGHGSVGSAEGDQGLGADHPLGRWIDSPGDPAVGFGGRSDESEIQGRIQSIVVPMEGGVEMREIAAESEDSVLGEGLRRAVCSVGSKSKSEAEKHEEIKRRRSHDVLLLLLLVFKVFVKMGL